MITLAVIQGPDQGKKFELPRNLPQLIGRSTEALPLTDNTISRRHAELTPDGDTWYIRDLESQNGTYVNGVNIRQRIKLQPGDQIRVGSTVFVFGQTSARDPNVVRVVHPHEMDTEVEHRMVSNEDSMVLAEPEPQAAAVDHLRVIYELTKLTTQIAGSDELLRAVMDLVFEELKPERGVLMLRQAGEDAEMVPEVVKYRDHPLTEDDKTIKVSRTIIKAALEDAEGVLSSNAMTDPRFKAGDSVQQYQIRSAICSPITFGGQPFGVIYIDSSIANYTFTKGQLALMNAIGRHTGLALANIQQTARRVRAERLAAVGEAVASLSHSIKNILQGLRGGADVVEIGLTKGDAKIARSGWGILRRNLDRIVGLTMNMLAFSTPRTIELERTKVNKLVEECAQLLEHVAAEKQVALIVDADPEMPPIPVDANLIHQAVMNLLGNAIEAVEPETGMVTAKVIFHEPAGGALPARGQLSPPSFVEIAVIDNGHGIPQDRLSWIFEPFNTTKGLRGTGLGARGDAAHRGGPRAIRVETKQGRGSTFTVFIPADLGEAESTRTRRRTTSRTRRRS
ncbi:MAG: FHA domain-containing protein [Phycisphaerales bacterium]